MYIFIYINIYTPVHIQISLHLVMTNYLHVDVALSQHVCTPSPRVRKYEIMARVPSFSYVGQLVERSAWNEGSLLKRCLFFRILRPIGTAFKRVFFLYTMYIPYIFMVYIYIYIYNP